MIGYNTWLEGHVNKMEEFWKVVSTNYLKDVK